MARDRANWRQTIKTGAKVARDNWVRRENERRDQPHAVADSTYQGVLRARTAVESVQVLSS